MIPTISDGFLQDFTAAEIPSKDFALDIPNAKMNGTVEGLEQVKQSIYFILNTERYEHEIYSWDYGVEFADLIGQPHSYVIPEVERRVTEALLQDDRITAVSDFVFEKEKNRLHVTFTVTTIFGNTESEVTVSV